MNSSRARDDATLIPNLGDEFVEHGPRPCRSTGFAFFRPTKLEQDNGTGRIEAEDKFLVMSRKGKRLGVAFASTPRGEGGAASLKFKTK
jgi:hypothetical protein